MKYLKLLQFELKNIIKDKMNMFMLLYPILLVFIMGFMLPITTKGLTQAEIATSFPFIFIIILCIGPLIGGMLMGFSVIENKDEKTLNTIAVTPIALKGYLVFKSVYSAVISFFGTLVMILGIQFFAHSHYITFNPTTLTFVSIFDLLSFWHILLFSFTCALITPAVGLVLGAFAKNKVEGIVFIKSAGMVLMLPALALLNAFSGLNQYFLGIFPNFWFVKAIQNIVLFDSSDYNLPFYGYLAIGFVYTSLLCYLSYKIFKKRII